MVSSFYDDNKLVGTKKLLLSIFSMTLVAFSAEANSPAQWRANHNKQQINSQQNSGTRGAAQRSTNQKPPKVQSVQSQNSEVKGFSPPPVIAGFQEFSVKIRQATGELYVNLISQAAQETYRVCYAQVQPNFQNCSKAHDDAQNSCDSEKDSGINNAMNLAQQMSALASSSVAGACSKAGGLLASANAGLAAFRIRCNSNRNACISECTKIEQSMQDCVRKMAKNYSGGSVDQISGDILAEAQVRVKAAAQVYVKPVEFRKNCVAMEGKVREAEGAIGNFVNTMVTAKQCEEMTAAAVPDFCKSNPSAPGCKATSNDCSDPANASSTVCICQSNPMDPVCGGLKKPGVNLGGSPNGGSGLGGGSGDTGFDGNFSSEASSLNVGESAPASTEGEKGGGAGASFGGGGSGGGGMAGEGDFASEEDPTMVNSGFYGAAGAGGGGAFGDSGYGAGGGAYSENSDIYDGTKGGVPDLRQFLPNGSPNPDYAGSMAGMGGPDGITGPHTNIWLKINNRYKEKEDTLLKP